MEYHQHHMKTQILALAGRAWTTAPMSDTISSGDRPSQKTYSDTSNCGDNDLEVWSWKTVRPWAIAYRKSVEYQFTCGCWIVLSCTQTQHLREKNNLTNKEQVPWYSQLFPTLRHQPEVPSMAKTNAPSGSPPWRCPAEGPNWMPGWSWMPKVATFVWIWGQQPLIVYSVGSSSFFQYNVHILQCTTLGLHNWKAEGQSLEMDGC